MAARCGRHQRFLLRQVELRRRSAGELFLDQFQNPLRRRQIATYDAELILCRQYLEIAVGDGHDRGEAHDVAIVSGDGRILLGGIKRRAVLAPEIDHVAGGETDVVLRECRRRGGHAADRGGRAACTLGRCRSGHRRQ